ncbi:MAG: phosphoribosylglycinamide formyltransferase [Firmicutes bacterium]|nr:phosphoribosylglycinamide formyltransferase [Bacillota bacterium]
MQNAQKKRIAVLCSGSGSNLQALIDAEKENKFNGEICLVIASNPNAYALERAKQNNIQTAVFYLSTFATPELRDNAITNLLNLHNIDLVVLAGYLGILTPDFFANFTNPIINIHPSLLPKFGGAGMHGLAVHTAVINAKETHSGATVHYVDCGIDTGCIIAQDSLEILSTDTPEILQQRMLHQIEHPLLVKAVTQLCSE